MAGSLQNRHSIYWLVWYVVQCMYRFDANRKKFSVLIKFCYNWQIVKKDKKERRRKKAKREYFERYGGFDGQLFNVQSVSWQINVTFSIQ